MDEAHSKTELANQYESVIELLKLIQFDYRFAIDQLQDISTLLGQRESRTTNQLRLTLDALESISTPNNGSIYIHLSPGVQNHHAGNEGEPSTHSAPSLEVRFLGKFQASINQASINQWHSVKARSLLKYLVIQRGRPISKDVLIEVLWPNGDPYLANNNLKAAARALRQTLSAGYNSDNDLQWILFQDGNYMISDKVKLWLDIDEFEYRWQIGRRLERQGKTNEALSEYQTAEMLYKGDFLEDELYEDWTTLRREALKDIYLAILVKLADFSMQQGDYDGCTSYCRKILDKDICREDAYQRLMCSYSRLGQRSRAISWYRLCEKTIKTELDVNPQQRTVELYHKLLNDETI